VHEELLLRFLATHPAQVESRQDLEVRLLPGRISSVPLVLQASSFAHRRSCVRVPGWCRRVHSTCGIFTPSRRVTYVSWPLTWPFVESATPPGRRLSMSTATVTATWRDSRDRRRPKHRRPTRSEVGDVAAPSAPAVAEAAYRGSKPAAPRPSTKIRLAQICFTGSRPPGIRRAARTRYSLRPRAHAHQHRGLTESAPRP